MASSKKKGMYDASGSTFSQLTCNGLQQGKHGIMNAWLSATYGNPFPEVAYEKKLGTRSDVRQLSLSGG